MKEYLVTLEIITKDYSLQELEKLLNIKTASGSYSIDEICGLRGEHTTNSTALKLKPHIPKTADIVEHLNGIKSMVSEKKILDVEKIPANCSFLLNIGVLFDTPYCSVKIPPYYWNWMGENKISMEITCYSCSNDSYEDDLVEPGD